MPTIRIDEDVWAWLKRQAQPFEDTPNSVLRRVAGIDRPSSELAQTQRPATAVVPGHPGVRSRQTPSGTRLGIRVTGEKLNRQYQLAARHALYHKDGTFYERLAQFPAVYCDPLGFVRYESEQQFNHDTRLRIGQKVNVRDALNNHPRYQRFPTR